MHTSKKTVALRTVAVFEAAKGLIVLLLGLGLLRLVHKNLDEFAEQLIRFLHASPGGRLSNLFVTGGGPRDGQKFVGLGSRRAGLCPGSLCRSLRPVARPRMGGVVRPSFRRHVFAVGNVFAGAASTPGQVGDPDREHRHRLVHAGAQNSSRCAQIRRPQHCLI